MAAPVISVRQISKSYRLGAALEHDTLRDHLAHTAESLKNIFSRKPGPASPREQILWALRDVSFDVAQGEVIAIIGRNGAGKSTLLKILSQITEPTSGEIRIRGRLASLLEVGTGFHPELTGRENIFLNGAILGMSQKEIRRKFDEIVAFAEVDKFLDTPVKRYSSGMYVRLAFAVAAHLEPEILVVDEVLAVGDAQFQKRCLGKMHEFAEQQGRTVLFVSHNMTAVRSLCSRAILLHQGNVIANGEVEEVINAYSQRAAESVWERNFATPEEGPGNEKVRFKSVRLIPQLAPDEPLPTVQTPLRVECEFWNMVPGMQVNLSLHFRTIGGECLFVSPSPALSLEKGVYSASCTIPGNLLNDGIYSISMWLIKDRSSALHEFRDALTVELLENRKNVFWHGKWPGTVRPVLDWQFPQK